MKLRNPFLTLMASLMPRNIQLSDDKRIVSYSISGKKYANIPKGCKVFTINGVDIVSLNEKNALRKYIAKTKINA